jgi:DNA-binding HxlR family transcriptional regulator
VASDNRLVDTSKWILSLLLRKSNSVNQIIQQTSSDRSYVLETIKILQRDGLIIEAKDPNHTQKKIKHLTSLGQEAAELINAIDNYNEVYHKLNSVKEEYVNQIRDVTKSKGKEGTDLIHINRYVLGISILEYEIAECIKDLVIIRYASILNKFGYHNMIKTKTVKTILKQIITEVINRQMQIILDNFGIYGDVAMIGNAFDGYISRMVSLPTKIEKYGILDNEFVKKDAKKLLLSLAPLLRMSNVKVDDQIKDRIAKIKMDKKLLQIYDQIYDRDMIAKMGELTISNEELEREKARLEREHREEMKDPLIAFYRDILETLS